MTIKKKIIASVVSFLFLSILLAVFVIFPLFSEIKETSQAIPLKKQELVELEKKIENLEKFKKNLPEISLNLKKIDYLFIDSRKLVDFRVFWDEIAKKHSEVSLIISIDSLSSQVVNSDDPWKFMILQFDVAGPFLNFSNFLEKLESAPYLIKIQDLNIVSETKSFEFEQFYVGNIKAKLLIKVYIK